MSILHSVCARFSRKNRNFDAPATWRELGQTYNVDHPLVTYFAAAPSRPRVDTGIKLEVQAYLGEGLDRSWSLVAKSDAGTIPFSFADGAGETWKVKWDGDDNAIASPIASPLLDHAAPVSLAASGRRVIMGVAGRVSVWDLSDKDEREFHVMPRFRGQSSLDWRDVGNGRVQYELVPTGLLPERVSFSENVERQGRGNADPAKVIVDPNPLQWEQRFEELKQESAPFARRVLGREPVGPVFHVRVYVVALHGKPEDRRGLAGATLYFLREVSDSEVRPFGEARAKAVQVAAEAQRIAEMEREAEARREREAQEAIERQRLAEAEAERLRLEAEESAKDEAERQRIELARERSAEQRRVDNSLVWRYWGAAMLRWGLTSGSLSLLLTFWCIRSFRAGASAPVAVTETTADRNSSAIRAGWSIESILAYGTVASATIGFTLWFIVAEFRKPGVSVCVALIFVASSLWLVTGTLAARCSGNGITAQARVVGWSATGLVFWISCYLLLLAHGWSIVVGSWLILHVPALVCLVRAPLVEHPKSENDDRVQAVIMRPPAGTNPEYFMLIDNGRHGPFSLWQLQERGMHAESLVWRRGLLNWTPASEVPELRDALFRAYGKTAPRGADLTT